MQGLCFKNANLLYFEYIENKKEGCDKCFWAFDKQSEDCENMFLLLFFTFAMYYKI